MDPDPPEPAGALRILAVAVPFMAWSQLAVAATKARMRMEYDAARSFHARHPA